MRIFTLKYVAISLILAGLVFILAYQIGGSPGFPVLQEGRYAGQLKLQDEMTLQGNTGHLDIFAEKGSGHELLLIVSDNSAQSNSKRIHHFDMDGKDIKIKIAESTFFMQGSREGDLYKGTVSDETGSPKGDWYLRSISPGDDHDNNNEQSVVYELLTLSAEIRKIDQEINVQELTVSQQKSEIERLTYYLTEGNALRHNTDKRYAEKKRELADLQNEKKIKLEEARKLRERFEIAQRIGGMGKLVYLARNAVELESRWFESMYSSSRSGIGSDFDEVVARAERIMALKEEIRSESIRRGEALRE